MKLSEFIKRVDYEIESNGTPTSKGRLLTIKEQIIKKVEEHGYTYDMFGKKITKD